MTYWAGRGVFGQAWYKPLVPLWIERYLIPICAAIVFGIVILNPFKFDWPQRISLFIAISAFAYFLAHTVYKPKVASPPTDPRIGGLEREVTDLRAQQQKAVESAQEQVRQLRATIDLRQQQRKTRDQIAVLMGEGNVIKHRCGAPEKPELEDEAFAWAKKTSSYLQSIEPSYAARFDYPAGPTYGGVGPGKNAETWNFVNLRNEVLKSILQELRD